MTIIYCTIAALVVYYLALWGWYRHADNKTENSAGNGTLPEKELSDYTLIGESRYKGGQTDPQPDKAGHFPQAVENDTIFAPEAAGTDDTPGYADDEPDYEDEEIAGYMDGDDDTGRATGVSFDELGEAVRTANADNSTEAEQRQAAGTLERIEGTNLYDAVVENINGGLAKVAELLGRNEAELATAAIPAGTSNTSKEHEAFDMNDFL